MANDRSQSFVEFGSTQDKTRMLKDITTAISNFLAQVEIKYNEWIVYNVRRHNDKSWYQKLGLCTKEDTTLDQMKKIKSLDYYISMCSFASRANRRLN